MNIQCHIHSSSISSLKNIAHMLMCTLPLSKKNIHPDLSCDMEPNNGAVTNNSKYFVTTIPFEHGGSRFVCAPNEESVIINAPYACYMCAKGFRTKDKYDAHFQQKIPRDREQDKSAEEIHLAHLIRVNGTPVLEVQVKRGTTPLADQLVLRNLEKKNSVSINHIYMINSETASHRLASVQLKAGAQRALELCKGNLAFAVENTVIVRFAMDGTSYLEQHKLGVLCCSIGKYPANKVPIRPIDQRMYDLAKSPAQLRFSLEHHLRISNANYLNADNYSSVLEKCTMLEQIENQLCLDKYERKMYFRYEDIHGNRVHIMIDEVEDMLPDLTRYDTIHIKLLGQVTKLKAITLPKTTKFQRNCIVAEFNKKIIEGHYNVKFVASTYPFYVEHYALQQVMKFGIVSFLFPTPEDIIKKVSQPSGQRQMAPNKWFNEDIKSNPFQMQAVNKIVQGTAHPYPYILYGPPGTGKTKTLVEAICQIAQDPKSQILVCATSNAAADELAIRLNRNLFGTCPFDHRVLRMYSRDYFNFRKIEKELVSFSNYCLGYCPDNLDKFQIIVATLMVAGGLQARNNSASKMPPFTHILLDECSSATESATLVPLLGAFDENGVKAQIVLAGDPKQLGPVIKNIDALSMGYDQSMFERLLKSPVYAKDPRTGVHNPNVMTKLLFNFRSHSAIIDPSNSMFYDNELAAVGPPDRTHCFINWDKLPVKDYPVVFHARVNTIVKRELNSKSYFNWDEINTIVYYVGLIVARGINGRPIAQSEIGIISPYKKQVQKITYAMRERNWNDITVSSIEMFQGKEKPIILVSTVRSGRIGIGFLRNEKRLNVMLTRAQALMIVVGDPLLLNLDRRWHELLVGWKKKGICTGDEFQLRSTGKKLHPPQVSSWSQAVASNRF